MPVLKYLRLHSPKFCLVVAILGLLALSYFRVFDRYEFQTYDWRMRISVKPPVSQEIVIVGIDDASLQQIGEWPFDRAYHGALLDVLREYGARMLGLDVLFVEATHSDAVFKQAAQKMGRVYFANAYADIHRGPKGLTSTRSESDLLDYFKDAASGIGYVNTEVDIDGTRRRIPPLIHYKDEQRLHLGVLLAAEYLGIDPEEVTLKGQRLSIGDYASLPLDENGRMLIPFAGSWKNSFRYLSYAQILIAQQQIASGQTPDLDLRKLKDKICILGYVATATVDVNPIPLEPIYPGVGIYANVVNMILQKAGIMRLNRFLNLLILGLLMLVAVTLARLDRIILSVLLALLATVSMLGLSLVLFNVWHWWMDLFFPLGAFVGVYLAGMIRRTLFEMKKRQMIEAEMAIASRIQTSFLPESLPESKVLDISVYMLPAKHVGGDLYNIFQIDPEHIGLLLGDVSGKGMPAALFMAKSVAEFKFHSKDNIDPAQVLTNMNNSLAKDTSSGLFVTANYVVFDTSKPSMLLSNAGHMHVLRVAADGKSSLLSPEGGMPLALMPDIEFLNLDVPIKPGDIFVLYSDGISEARNTKRVDYEMDNLTQAVSKLRGESAQAIQEGVLADIQRFVGSAPQHDDMTLIVVKAKPRNT